MKIKVMFICLLVTFGAFQGMSQKRLVTCDVSFANIQQNCGDDGAIDLSFNIITDSPGQMPCAISKIEIVHGAVIGLPPLEDPSTLSIANFSSANTYTISGAIPGRTNCYDVNLIDEEGNVCCRVVTCVEVEEKQCCDLDVEIKTNCKGEVEVFVLGGTAPFTVFGANEAASEDVFEEQDLDPGTYDLTIVDSEGCRIDTTYTIPENDLTAEWEFRGCSPGGYVAITINGGSGNYHVIGAESYSDDPTIWSYEDDNITPGTYPLIVTDRITGCRLSTFYVVPEPLSIIDIDWDIEDCEIIVTLGGGTPDYSLLSGNDFGSENPFDIYIGEGSDISSLSSPILFEDANGCTVSFIPADVRGIPQGIIDCEAEFNDRSNSTIIDENAKIGHQGFSVHEIKLFPSPVSDVLNINILDDLNNFSSLGIIDSNGKALMTQDFSDQKQLSLDTSAIPSGIYFLQLTSKDGNRIVKRFVKN